MRRWMFVPCLALLLVALACPVRAVETDSPSESVPTDAIVDEAPPPAEPDPEPVETIPPVPTSFPMVSASPVEDGSDASDSDFFFGVDDIALPEETVDLAALMEVLSSINLFLAYIVVGAVIMVGVTFAKLIYSFFNMFF